MSRPRHATEHLPACRAHLQGVKHPQGAAPGRSRLLADGDKPDASRRREPTEFARLVSLPLKLACVDQGLALPEVKGRFGDPNSGDRRSHTPHRNSSAYRLGMDYLPVAHDQTLITLVRPKGFRPGSSPNGMAFKPLGGPETGPWARRLTTNRKHRRQTAGSPGRRLLRSTSPLGAVMR